MPRIPCEVVYEDVTQDGVTRPGVTATCSECEHQTCSFGQGDGSVKRCFVLMRQECPEGREDHFYVDEDDDD